MQDPGLLGGHTTPIAARSGRVRSVLPAVEGQHRPGHLIVLDVRSLHARHPEDPAGINAVTTGRSGHRARRHTGVHGHEELPVLVDPVEDPTAISVDIGHADGFVAKRWVGAGHHLGYRSGGGGDHHGHVAHPGPAYGSGVVRAGDGPGQRIELHPASHATADPAQIVGKHQYERREHSANKSGVRVVDGTELGGTTLVVHIEVVAFFDDVHLANVDAVIAGERGLGVDALRPASVGDHLQFLKEGALAGVQRPPHDGLDGLCAITIEKLENALTGYGKAGERCVQVHPHGRRHTRLAQPQLLHVRA